MDRAEATGFGVAFAGHAALLAALSLGFAAVTRPPMLNDPMEVSFVEDVGPVSAAPAAAEPAPRSADAPAEILPPTPTAEPVAAPPPVAFRPAPQPVPPKARALPSPPKPSPKQSATPRPRDRLAGILEGVGERPSDSRSTAPRGAEVSAQVRASLGSEVRRQLKPHWKAPSGADVELLRTELSIALAPNGTVTRVEVVRTTGQNASNRPQVKLHQEQALRAVRLASPFRLPPEYYEAWKELTTIFDKRLSQ
jgi:outer membrane biosynthesis protein TonB